MLARGLEALERKSRGFAVPTPMVTSCLANELLIDYPPAEIDAFLADWVFDGERRSHTSDNFLSSGDWTPISSPIMDSPVAREALELKACDLDFRATDAYAEMVRATECGKALRRQQVLLDRRELIDDYFRRFAALFRSIREEGVLPYHLLREKGKAQSGERNVGIGIGCGGEVYRLPGGQHRTAIAKVLGLSAMPVEVRLVHTGWLREIMIQTGSPPAHALREGIALLKHQYGMTRQGGSSAEMLGLKGSRCP
jgi:hypothetical protein